jgi:hypothetical protein
MRRKKIWAAALATFVMVGIGAVNNVREASAADVEKLRQARFIASAAALCYNWRENGWHIGGTMALTAGVTSKVTFATRRLGNVAYATPIDPASARREGLTMRWLIAYVRKNGRGQTIAAALAAEDLVAKSRTHKEVVHRMSSTCSFNHYSW